MSLSDGLNIVIVAIVAIWGIISVYETHKLRRQVARLQTRLDQSLQILHRAREAVIRKHKAEQILRNYKGRKMTASETYAEKNAEWSAYAAELRGLAFAIGDKELLDIVNEGKTRYEDEELRPAFEEMELRNQSQRLHTRISELIAEKTK